jgi:hypothetical protein
MAGAQAWINTPIRKRRMTSRAMCGGSLGSTKRRLMSDGERRKKQVKATKRAPQRSVM